MRTKFDDPLELAEFWLERHSFEVIKFSKKPDTANSYCFSRYSQILDEYIRVWFSSKFRPYYEGKIIEIRNEMFLVEFPENDFIFPLFTPI